MKKLLLAATCLLFITAASLAYDRQDYLRGSNGTGRKWWDVLHYDLNVHFDTATQSIWGWNIITFKITAPPTDTMQIDLQDSMMIVDVLRPGDSAELPAGGYIIKERPANSFVKDGNAWYITGVHDMGWKLGTVYTMEVKFRGKPRQAVRPPWDGGFIWSKDSMGKPWIAVACQGLGASCWWPCKDYQGDEPDSGMDITYTIPEGLVLVSNGRLLKTGNSNHRRELHWRVTNPINSYDATFYIGDYVHWSDTLTGEKGKLDLDFYALRYNEAKARQQFAVTKPMLHCFEYWMGPYPFYKDGYKLVEAPYLGMEHQSAVAYGNEYQMGYRGRDRSNTGEGLKFDFIIVHESGHEWFGNNITAKDIADNWIHEGFTTYTEALFAECLLGREKAFAYTTGEWHNIRNDNPVIGPYGVNAEGSSDMYDKGSAVVHMIRMVMQDDNKFRELLRSLNEHFYHQTVTEPQFEAYINSFTGIDFTPLFNQYLRTAQIPVLEYYVKKKELYYRFTNTVPGFTLPVAGENTPVLHPTGNWQHIKWPEDWNEQFNKNFLVEYKKGIK